MMKRFATLRNWNEDIEITTENKLAKIIESLPQFHRYIKENYVLKNLGFTEKTNDFLQNYFKRTPTDRTSKIQIGRYLKSMGVEPKKRAENKKDGVKQHYIYEVKNKELYDVFIKNKWINESVDVVDDENYEDEKEKDVELNEMETRLEVLKREAEELELSIKKKKEEKEKKAEGKEENEKEEEKPTSIIKQTAPIQDLIVEEVEKEEEDKPKIVMKGRLSPERIERMMVRRREREAKETEKKEAEENQQQKRGNVVEETDTLFDMEI